MTAPPGADPASGPAAGGRDSRRPVLIAATLASAMGFIDGSVTAIAIPAIRDSLGATLAEAQWVNNAYMLALSALILAGGAAGDRHGVRAVLLAGIALFVAASMACAAAMTPGQLVAARLVQGIGAALMVPGSLALISQTFPPGMRARAIGTWASASALATALGPLAGGLVLSTGTPWAWRAIFAINLVLGGLAAWLLATRAPARRPAGGTPPDLAGALLATLALGALAWALTGPQDGGAAQDGGTAQDGGAAPDHARLAGFGTLAVLAGLAFLWRQARARHPMMPLSLFRNRAFAAANLLTFFLYFALSAVVFFLPMTLVAGWNLRESQVALAFLPVTAAIALGSRPAGWLAARAGPALPVAAGAALVALGYGALAAGIGWRSFWGLVLPAQCLTGLGMALVVAPLSAAVMGAAADADAGAASGINNAVSRVAGLVAVAAMGALAASTYARAGGPSSFGAILDGGNAAHMAAIDAGFSAVAWTSAALAALAAVVAAAGLPRGPQTAGAQSAGAQSAGAQSGPRITPEP
jgi:MFS family permease